MRKLLYLFVFVAIGWMAICIYHIIIYSELPEIPAGWQTQQQAERESYKRQDTYAWQRYQR